MSRNDPPRHRRIHDPGRAEADRARDERVRDPYEAQRPVRTFGDEHPHAAAHPWDAAHDGSPDHLAIDRAAFDHATPHWSEQPARYGGGYRGDDPRASAGARVPVTDHRGTRNGWDDERLDHYGHGQSNSGYDTRDADNERLRQQEGHRHDAPLRSPRGDRPDGHRPMQGGGPGRGYIGAQAGHQDTYGSAGYQQEGKRYQFDQSGDERGRAQSFRGVRPRNYVRSDERLREQINEQLTDADLDASDIEVHVNAGTVTLEGTVIQRWMKHQAEDIVDACGGGTDIHNHLRIRRPGRSNQPGQPAATTASAPTEGAPVTASATTAEARESSREGTKERADGGTETTASSPPGEPTRKH